MAGIEQIKELLTDEAVSQLAHHITNDEAKGYFLLEAGKEHYRLLAALSTLHPYIDIADIGTYKGCSALALCYNPKNRVFSYDISDMAAIWPIPENIVFKIGELDWKQIIKCRMIMLDTVHDGIHEREVIDHLIKKNWKGILILDDIHHFPEQNKLWNEITLRKEDITDIGHWSGTGLIYFE